MNFNQSQAKAVEHFKGPALVVAGPGSGKTAVLTNRIASLIEKGVPSNKIVVITFTKAAAKEMMERFEGLLKYRSHSVAFGTFHSFFYRILKEELNLKSDSLMSKSIKTAILKEAYCKVCKTPDKDNTAETLDYIAKEISFLKNSNIALDDYKPSSYPKALIIDVMVQYERLKESHGLIDFDDMLTKTHQLLVNKPDVLSKWQSVFDYYLVDEAQDMNSIQYKIIKMLSAPKNNLFLVGDDDQSIYGFRGANPRIMLGFSNDYPDCNTIVLDHNYRSGKKIVEASINVISHNKNRFCKNIIPFKTGGNLIVKECKDVHQEASDVVDAICKEIESGTEPKNIAVLYRNHQYARGIVEQLILHKLPFYLKDNMPNIYTHFVMEDMETYFEIAIGNATRARMARIINRPNRYILRQSIELDYSFQGMKRFYRDNNAMYRKVEALERDINLISKMSPFAATNYIKKGMGYESFLKLEAMEKGYDVDELMLVLENFSDIVKDCKSIKAAIEKLQYLRLQVDYKNKNNSPICDGIGLYSLHSSNGLEFDCVFITDANETVIPSKKALNEEMIQEERRLFYVGLTRAKSRLFIFYLANKNRERMYPSRFINELYSASS